MEHIYTLQKTDGMCDIDQVLSLLRVVPGVESVVLLEGTSNVRIITDDSVTLEMLNAALEERIACRLVQS